MVDVWPAAFEQVFWPVVLVLAGLWIWSIVWAYRDAKRRDKNGMLVALMVALVSWPFSLLIWLAFRPDKIALRPPRRQHDV